jgi:hypothetical protein
VFVVFFGEQNAVPIGIVARPDVLGHLGQAQGLRPSGRPNSEFPCSPAHSEEPQHLESFMYPAEC